MAKMIKCKTCGAEIAKSAKRCPSCGARVKHTGTAIACVFVVFIALIAIISVADDDNGGSTNQEARSEVLASSHTQETATPPEPIFTPISGTVGNWEITVNDYTFKNSVSVGLLQYTSSENAKFCLVKVTVKNIGKEADSFLPYFVYGDMSSAKITWNGYEYTRSDLFWSDDNLSSEQLNPLVTATGDIAFDVPDDLVNSDIPPVLVISAGGETFTCELVKN